MVQERRFARAPLSARGIALNHLELHVRSKVCVSDIQDFLLLEIQSFLLLKHVQCPIYDKTGQSRVMKANGDSH